MQSSDQTDPNSTPGDDSGSADEDGTVTLTPVAPSFSKAGSPLSAAIGETVFWTITITNPSGIDLNNVIVSDPVWGQFDIISAYGGDSGHERAGRDVLDPGDPPRANRNRDD